MKSRLCLSEEVLSGYMAGCGDKEERARIEEHLADCISCRELVLDAHEILKKNKTSAFWKDLAFALILHRWFFVSFTCFILSFIMRKYFIQCLMASLIMGMKWALDLKTVKMLITVYENLRQERTTDPAKKYEGHTKVPTPPDIRP
ncbi:MAG: zf-HC2 domain-containing protein [Candidatus Omnitrophica bacterium]|nr:zf-HC2 domain-containing protein [Candidatus Omnitrophota bacterium]